MSKIWIIIEIAFFIAVIVVIVRLIKAIILQVRGLRNSVRHIAGKEDYEMQKAKEILINFQKNGKIPLWAAEDAVKTLKGYYETGSAYDFVNGVIADYNIQCVNSEEFPKSFWIDPGKSNSDMTDILSGYFEKLDLEYYNNNGSMSEKDGKTMKALYWMTYFADNDVNNIESAKAVVDANFIAFSDAQKMIKGVR